MFWCLECCRAVGIAGGAEKCAHVVETLGFEAFVHLACGPHTLVARMEMPSRPLRVGQTLTVALKMSQTHLFDRETSHTLV